MDYQIYQFHYPDKNITQKKILLPIEIYNTYKAITDDDEAKKFLKSHTKGMEWFIPGSPYFDAVTTGIVNANGSHPVIVTKL